MSRGRLLDEAVGEVLVDECAEHCESKCGFGSE